MGTARHDVELPGRGRTWVRDLPGPPGAPPLVLLHGWMATADLNWRPAYAALSARYRVLAMDLRGHGRGIPPRDRFRLEDCADDVAALAAALDLSAPVVAGYSMGGAVAQLVAHRHPRLVRGLVLCATASHFPSSTPWAAGMAAAEVALSPLGTLPPGWSGTLLRRATSVLGRRDERLRDGVDVRSLVQAGRSLRRFDSRPWLGGLGLPAAAVVTADDTVVPTGRQMDTARRAGASVHRVEGSHRVCVEAPERFVPALLGACATVAGPSPAQDRPSPARG